ncbi:MAG TPA: NnrU family protein [Rhodanobacteraceae bacterium]|nr:NnrU family protein [Rhodanobacteraceae bacterium]
MVWLILGLLLFLGVHSVRIVADGVRTRQIARYGENSWKAIYSVIALAGFVLIVWGFGVARQTPVLLYTPPLWLQHLNALFVLMALLLVAAAYVPGNHLKAWVGHPMLAGVKAWALGHLLATGFLHDVVLFGSFLLWAVLDFVACRRRDRHAGVRYPAGTVLGDLAVLVAGVALWALFAFYAHLWLIGRSPLL